MASAARCQHRRPGHQCRGQVEAAAHASRVGLERSSRRFGKIELLEQLGGAATPLGPAQMVEAPHQHQVLHPGQAFVDRGILAGQPDHPPGGLGMGDDVDAHDVGVTRIGLEQRGQNSRTTVVLPAPLGSSKPRTVPVGISKLTPSRARTSPLNVFTNASTTTAGADGAAMSKG